MKKLIGLLLSLLLFGSEVVSITVTTAQALAVIETASSTASATKFYNLVSDDLTSDMTQAVFTGYYKPNFVEFDLNDFNALLSAYTNAVEAKNYTKAQANLIKLSAAAFKGIDTSYIPDALEGAQDPWGSGKQFFSYDHSTEGPLDEDFVQSFVDQFDKLHAELVPPVVVKPAGGNTTNGGQSSTAGMLAERQSAINKIVGYQDDATQELSSETATLTKKLNSIKSSAVSDDNIGEHSVKTHYLSELSGAVTTGQDGLTTSADGYLSSIKSASRTALANLDLLATQDNNVAQAAVYKSNISTQATDSKNAINKALNSHTGTINSLESSIEDEINSAKGSDSGSDPNSGNDPGKGGNTGSGNEPGKGGNTGNSTEPSGGSSGGKSWAENFFTNVGDDLGTAGALGLAGGVVGVIKWKFFGGAKPTAADFGLPDSYDKFFDAGVDNLTKIINSDSPKQAVMDIFKDAPSNVVDQLSTSIRESLGMEPDAFNSVLSTVSDASGSLGKLGDITDTISEVAGKIPGVSQADVSAKLGDVLAEGGSLSDVNDLVKQVTAKLNGDAPGDTTPGSGQKIDTGSGEGNDSSLSDAFKGLDSSSDTSLEQQIKDYLQTNPTTKAQFEAQIDNMKASVTELEGKIEDETDAAQKEEYESNLKSEQAKLDAANEVNDDPDAGFEGE